MADNVGDEMHRLCRRLFPICRSITGNGVRESLRILQEYVPRLELTEVPSGTRVFDWTVPDEWNIRDAYIVTPAGERICEFSKSNLHVVGYSHPIDAVMSLEELLPHLHSLPEQPEAIPYITSYYRKYWGFCIADRERAELTPGNYHVVIDSDLGPGALTYGEAIIPGRTEREIFLSTYLCHPSLANNELSGPAVTAFLARWIEGLPSRRYTYRIIFIPETIGSITYLSRNLEAMQERVVAGFNITCVGDERAYSYLPSRNGRTAADRAALHVLRHLHPDFVPYTFLDRGSDERQYCSPGVDLPVCSIMRTRYGDYPEYHTSLDDLELISPAGLAGAYEAIRRAIECLEFDRLMRCTVLGEPQLGKRGLYPSLSTKTSGAAVRDMLNFLAYADGGHSAMEICDIIGVPLWQMKPVIEKLEEAGLLAADAVSSFPGAVGDAAND